MNIENVIRTDESFDGSFYLVKKIMDYCLTCEVSTYGKQSEAKTYEEPSKR